MGLPFHLANIGKKLGTLPFASVREINPENVHTRFDQRPQYVA
jgi:hypothetical protein